MHSLNQKIYLSLTIMKQIARVLEPIYIFRGHSTREPESVVCDGEPGDLLYSEGLTQEPASVVCDGEQGDLLYSEGLTQEPASATAIAGKIRGRFGKK